MFKAETQKSIRSMRYSKEWILDCVIMCTKGTKLYKVWAKTPPLTSKFL